MTFDQVNVVSAPLIFPGSYTNPFTFDPAAFADEFHRNSYVHIKAGVSQPFLREALRQLTDHKSLARNELPSREIKNQKKQYLFELPPDAAFLSNLKGTISQLTGLMSAELTLSERHIMVYDDHASPLPPLHKDRFATQFAIGIPLEPCKDARIILFPRCAREVNPLDNAIYCERDTLLQSPSAVTEEAVNAAPVPKNGGCDPECVELDVQPGDVVIFEGSSIYHGRLRSAGSSVLYMKFNAMHLDPLAEDPGTGAQRQKSLEILCASTDEELMEGLVEVSPRLQRVSRHYTRMNWLTVLQAYVGGEKGFAISELDLRVLMALQQRCTARYALTAAGVPESQLLAEIARIRRLIKFGAIDCLG